MDNEYSGPENEGNPERVQSGEGGSMDKLSSGDEFLFNLFYPLAVEVYNIFFAFLEFNRNS